jgi:mRNA interferase MazF
MVTRKSALWVPDRAEIIFIEYGTHKGIEMSKNHLMLVMSTKAFSELTGTVVGFPITLAECNADNPFAIAARSDKGEVGYVLTHQPKSFDWKLRNARPHLWGGGHNKLLNAVLKRFDSVFNVCSH